MTDSAAYEWDPEKNRINQAKHGVPFESVTRFDWGYALEREDKDARRETRHIAIGPIGTTLYVLVFTERQGALRVISLREAEPREIKRWKDEFYE